MTAVFLSASVPVAGRGEYYKTADVMLIQSAVRAFVTVTIGRRLIVWGGHPAITPMIWTAAEDLGVSYSKCVHLFQSKFFQDQYPDENARFQNATFVDAIDGDRDGSLKRMRVELLKSYQFEAAVFIGGMEGVFEELQLFRDFYPNSQVIPIASAGGAALEIALNMGTQNAQQMASIDYVGIFHNSLGIAPDEQRQDINFSISNP